MLITMSTSVAPFLIAFSASKALTSAVLAPKGKPITVHTATSVPANNSAAFFTQVGFTHTDIKLYSAASSQSVMICASVASGFNNV